MKTMLLSKPLFAAIVAGCVVTFAVGVQYAPFTGGEAVAQRQSTPLNTGPTAEEGRSSGRPRTEALGEIKIPATATVSQDAAQTAAAIDVYDRKPRSAIERKIAAALTTTVSRMDFVDTPLEQVIGELAAVHNIPIQLDVSPLDDAGLGPDEPVRFSAEGISLRSALRHLLRQLNLTYIVRDEVMLITTPIEAENHLETRFYPLEDRNSAVTLQQLIKLHVLPEAWVGTGGSAEISAFSSGLVITQTYEGHEQIHGPSGKEAEKVSGTFMGRYH